MASGSSTTDTSLPESVRRLLKGYEYITGTIDYEKYAQDEGIPSIEAARKRFKRAFEAHNLDVTTRGDNITGATATNATATPTTPKTGKTVKSTTKRKAIDADDDDETLDAAVKTPKSTSKKAKKTTLIIKKDASGTKIEGSTKTEDDDED